MSSQPAAKVDFAKEIAPILKSKCVSCHGPEAQSGGLRLDTIAGIKKGGDSGKLIEPLKSADSLLLKRILGQGGPRMPMGFAPLSDEATQKIRNWIDQGAVLVDPKKVKHWAYFPPVRPLLPVVKDRAWVRNPIDAFVLARLSRGGLKPSVEAPKEILARRASLDLTGLPPTVEELDRFLADKRPNAYERYVDRLLASPHYGERMARIWLDLARYADTNGYEKDLPRQMWTWRDWVINAYNRNLPYDEFTVEQIAGDLLPNPTRDQLIATGFHRNSMLNDEGGIDTEEFRVVGVMDRVDATATTWLGSTLACAQCHDHKYDPFSQKDYYSFYAFFNQSEDNGRDATPVLRLPSPEQEKEAADLDARIQKLGTELAARTPELMRKMPEWEQSQQTDWKTPVPEAKAAEATLTVLPDRSILASGADPDADLYTVTAPLEGGKLAGIRIEAIPDPSLPEGSSGRNFNGNFVLRRVKAVLSGKPIEFASAKADFAQEGMDPQSTLGDGLGWAIAAFQPENRVRHSLVLGLKTPVDVTAGEKLVVTLEHQTKFPKHNLGRFRISTTSNADLAAFTPPTPAIQAILSKETDKRAKVETDKLVAFYTSNAPEVGPQIAERSALMMKRRQIDEASPTVMVMRDLMKKRPNRILKRGDFRTPGDPVSPASPVVLGGAVTRQDRLGLARWLVSPKNPLTARVEANRLWEQCFGRGLVATPEDFGTQGDPPSHPELLDWLAIELIARKWDIKSLLRTIVTSATYRQSSKVAPALLKRDPYNVLLARGPRFRVEAEAVRDIALTASGRLTPTIGGPSVMPPQPPGIWENSFSFYDTKERWVDDTGPNRYRRGLYTFWRRTAPFPMELTFDLKSRDMCVAHRSRTNSPLQALNTLNDSLFFECAGALGQKIAVKGLVYGFRACTSRGPKASELSALTKLYSAALQRYQSDGDARKKLFEASGVKVAADEAKVAAWIVVANTILNLDETITKQ